MEVNQAFERRNFVSYGSLYVSQDVQKRLLHLLFNGSRGFTVGFFWGVARDFAAIRINDFAAIVTFYRDMWRHIYA